MRSTMGTLVAITRDVLEEEDENEAHLGELLRCCPCPLVPARTPPLSHTHWFPNASENTGEGAGAGGAAGADAAVFTNGHSKSKAPLSMKEELEVRTKCVLLLSWRPRRSPTGAAVAVPGVQEAA